MPSSTVSYNGSPVEIETESGYVIIIDPLYAVELKDIEEEYRIELDNG